MSSLLLCLSFAPPQGLRVAPVHATAAAAAAAASPRAADSSLFQRLPLAACAAAALIAWADPAMAVSGGGKDYSGFDLTGQDLGGQTLNGKEFRGTFAKGVPRLTALAAASLCPLPSPSLRDDTAYVLAAASLLTAHARQRFPRHLPLLLSRKRLLPTRKRTIVHCTP